MDYPQLDNPTLISTGQNSFSYVHGQDKDLHTNFELVPQIDQVESNKAGHPVYKDVLFVRVAFPGDKTKMLHMPATDDHKARWPMAYQRFLQNVEDAVIGWRLEEWPVLSRSDVENLKQFGIKTVEQVAALSDSNLDSIGLGARSYRDKAISAIEQAHNGSALTRLQSELERLRADNAALHQQLSSMSAISSPITEDVIATAVERALQNSKAKRAA